MSASTCVKNSLSCVDMYYCMNISVGDGCSSRSGCTRDWGPGARGGIRLLKKEGPVITVKYKLCYYSEIYTLVRRSFKKPDCFGAHTLSSDWEHSLSKWFAPVWDLRVPLSRSPGAPQAVALVLSSPPLTRTTDRVVCLTSSSFREALWSLIDGSFLILLASSDGSCHRNPSGPYDWPH